MGGLITLVLLAFLVAWLISKVGRKMRFNMPNRRVIIIMFIVAFVALVLWDNARTHK